MSRILETSNRVNVTDLKIEHSVGSLSMTFSDLKALDASKSTITMYVDGAKGKDERIATQYPLLPYLLLSTIAEGQIIETDKGFTAYCPLTDSANILLQEKETLNIDLKNLPSQSTAIIDTLEYPLDGGNLITFERKVITSEESRRKIDVTNSDYVLFKDLENAEDVHFLYDNGKSIKYSVEEIKAISRDFDPIKIINKDGTVTPTIDGYTSMNLGGVQSIEIYKGAGQISLFLMQS